MSRTSSHLWPTLTSIVSTTTGSFLIPTSTASASVPTPSVDNATGLVHGNDETLLCDWIRSAADCRDADFIRIIIFVSSAMHLFVGCFGLWLIIYRNRGLNSKIFTELFILSGRGIKPKPMDCIVFFTGIASFFKVIVNMPLLLDVLKDMLWLRILLEQTYWVIVAIGFSTYFVGLLYAMPVTTKEGIFAVYQPETALGADPLPPIHVLTPTTGQKNFLLVMGALYPTIFGAGAGYSNWVLILWSMALMFFYYGVKYTFILQANILIAESVLRAPGAAFDIRNLRSSSPARFLFIQLQITGFGGGASTALAGTLCMIWVLRRDEILRMPNDQLPHTMAFFWTCAIAVCFLVIMSLIAGQTVRNRRRGLHEPESSTTNSFLPNSNSQKSAIAASKDIYSSQAHKTLSVQSESEARLTQRSSGELSTLHSILSNDKDILPCQALEPLDSSQDCSISIALDESNHVDHDAFILSHYLDAMDQEQIKKMLAGSMGRSAIVRSTPAGESSILDGRRDSDASTGPSVQVLRGPIGVQKDKKNVTSGHYPNPTLSGTHPLTENDMSKDHNGTGYSNTHQQQFYKGLQHQHSGKGLSPPPRPKRLTNRESPEHGHAMITTVPDYADDIMRDDRGLPESPSSARHTFMSSPPLQPQPTMFSSEELEPGHVYTDVPQIGGGTRRKSIKDAEKAELELPVWQAPMYQD
ncbi:hypothetical protein BGW38_007459 [Lunasporangiospora selenospora]|uniref:Uncharacterized protein n=1 Tax=Lunasporangiospora selenospora TaxID=979761 RepID=A0A9P6G0M7_9FUNG|nr:hypothetical protein BGW38_007459 [Lunasporangiospora selenospora]